MLQSRGSYHYDGEMPNTTTFESRGGADAAITSTFTMKERRPYPALPRLQIPAVNERQRSYRRLTGGTGPDAVLPAVAGSGFAAAGAGFAATARGASRSSPRADSPLKTGTTIGHSLARSLPASAGAGDRCLAGGIPSPRPHPHRPVTCEVQHRPALPLGIADGAVIDVPQYAHNTRWFDETKAKAAAVVGHELHPNNPTSTSNPKLTARTKLRSAMLFDIERSLRHEIPANLKQVAHMLMAVADDEGRVNAALLGKAMKSLDVEDVEHVDNFFGIADVHREGALPLGSVLALFDASLNDPVMKAKARAACFAPFNLHKQGYIHKAHVDKLRRLVGKEDEFRHEGCTAPMVRVLGDLFKQIHVEDELEYIATKLQKGKKKKKKKAPPLKPNQASHIPIQLRKTEHISFEKFDKYFDENKEVASAFAPLWFQALGSDTQLQHALTLRAIELADEVAAGFREEDDDSSGADDSAASPASPASAAPPPPIANAPK